jgi:hypothetical protein
MKIGTGLALICVGAILAFAVTATPSFFNLHTAGYILIFVGVIGMAIPRRSYGWIGRRLFVRRYETRPGGQVENVTYPPYVTRTPANTRVRAGLPVGTGDPNPEHVPGETEVTEDIYEE